MKLQRPSLPGVCVGSVQSIFDPSQEMPNFWVLSYLELANSCKRVAESRSGPANAPLRAESMHLFLMWREVLQSSNRHAEEHEDRNLMAAGLRKRTIQILVRLSLQGLLPTLEY